MSLKQWYEAIDAAKSVEHLEEIRIAIFGKKGELAVQFALCLERSVAYTNIESREI